jgi:pentatricopeptide repeat protein
MEQPSHHVYQVQEYCQCTPSVWQHIHTGCGFMDKHDFQICQQGYGEQAAYLFGLMQQEGLKPDK